MAYSITANIHLVPDYKNIKASMALAEDYNACFEYNDFFNPAVLDDENEVNSRIERYKSLGRDRSHDTLHGAFLDIVIHSSDSLIRDASYFRVRQSMRIAQKLNIRGVVFHTGLIPNFHTGYYLDNWLAMNEEFWQMMLEEFPEQHIFMENMFDEEPDCLLRLAERMKGEERFGVCLDYAHAQVFGKSPEEWFERLKVFVRHLHINDNDGADDLHLPVGEGVIDWDVYDNVLKASGMRPSVLIETSSIANQRKSLEFMAAHRLYPFL